MGLSIVGQTVIALLLFSLFVAWKVGKKNDSKLGCVAFGYVALVVFVVGLFAVGITGIITASAAKSISTYVNGEKCTATVISYSSHYSTNDDGEEIEMYTPTYRIETSDGEVYEVESGFSSGGEPVVGDQLSVYFDKSNQHIVELSDTSVIMICGMLIMWMVLATAFVGIIMYAFNCNMAKYIRFVQVAGIYFFLPLVMICFEVLLIYGFFYGNDIPFWASALLLFFIVTLGLGIVGFIMQLINKGTPKWERTGAGSWKGNNEEGETNKKKTTQKTKKLSNPLNEKYRKKD